MKPKKRSLIIWAVVIFTITLACACPGIPQEFFAAQQGIETIQAVLTDVPVDEMMKTAAALATEMPIEDVLGTVAVMGSAMPVSPEDLMKTASAGGLPSLPLPGMGENNPPPDIPIVGDRNDDLFTNQNLVSYTTSLELSTVVDFYQTEMLKNDWQPAEGKPVINPETAVLNYVKPQRDAMVTIYKSNNMTGVTITIETK